MKVNPFSTTTVFGMILVNFNTYNMVFNGQPYFNEIYTLYVVNTLQFISLANLVYTVFNELLDICDINMWSIKDKKDKKAKKTQWSSCYNENI